MDINGTRYHILNGRDDWEALLLEQRVRELLWDREQNYLSLLPEILQVPTSASSQRLTETDCRGAAQDRFGNFFWIADKGDATPEHPLQPGQSIRILPVAEQESGEYWSLELLQPGEKEISDHEQDFIAKPAAREPVIAQLSGLTITREHYLVVGTLNPGGLLVFDLHAGGPPSIFIWPEAVDFQPLDMAPAKDGGLWILDRDSAAGTGRAWRLDRHMRVINMGAPLSIPDEEDDLVFAQCEPATSDDETPVPVPVNQVRADYALTLIAEQPKALIGLEDDSLLVLAKASDGPHSLIERYVDANLQESFALAGGIIEDIFPDAVITGHDFAFVSRQPGIQELFLGDLSVVLTGGDQAVSFVLSVTSQGMQLKPRAVFIPLRRFTGKALVSGDKGIYYDLDERWYLLTEQPRRRFADAGSLQLRFDGKQAECRWHRIVFDGCIPDGTRVEVASRSADDEAELQFEQWYVEADPYRRANGSEFPYYENGVYNTDETPGAGSWEWLFHHASGRFVELRITFIGNRRLSPKLRSLRVYYPRFSYRDRYLPDLYAEQDAQAGFLERYLANVEGLFSFTETLVADAQLLFDTRTTPDEYLDWLAGWLGGIIDRDWEPMRKRLFIDNAELLYRWRGTRIGIRTALRLAIDECPGDNIFEDLLQERYSEPVGVGGSNVRIVERFTQRQLPRVATDTDSNDSSVLATTNISQSLSELGDSYGLSQRYREFLYWKYLAEAGDSESALEILNTRWVPAIPYVSFNDIAFSPERPQASAELTDWTQFVRRELARSTQWSPMQGGFALHVRYQEWLRKRYAGLAGSGEAIATLNFAWQNDYEGFEAIRFSAVLPEQEAKAADWLAFTQEGIGFTYSPVNDGETAYYREFLGRRYSQVRHLNEAHGLAGGEQWAEFDAINLPAEDTLPENVRALSDWITFVSLTLPMRNNAHKFTVLVPTTPGELPQQREQRKSRAEKVIRIEKPAHTDFDVKLFWALFQVGTARLGTDTLVGDGARFVGVVLGGTYLGQGYVQSAHPRDVQDRQLIGRDRLQAG